MGLGPLPARFGETRAELHRVAEEVVAPARKPDNEIALAQTPGGFGTPPFEFDGRRLQVMVAGAEIVVAENGDERGERLGSIAGAARFVGEELFPSGIPQDTALLKVDPGSAERLGELYEFARAALERFRGSLGEGDEASDLNLWPEHFDIAFEAGSEERGLRAGFGVSPGDENHPEPYAYVGPWSANVEGELWNANGFTGAELGYQELVEADDPVAVAAEFFRTRYDSLTPR